MASPLSPAPAPSPSTEDLDLPGTGESGVTRRLRRLAPASLTLALYAALAVALLWHGLFAGRDTVVGFGNDPPIFIWNLAWVPFALAHHLNPLLATVEHYPGGANLMWNTSIVFPALVLTPITELFGPLVSYNLLAVLAIALSAWCAFLAIRRFTERWLPAAVGGLVYGFSPYMYLQTLGHPHLSIAVFPPLAVILGDAILVRQRRSPIVIGGLLGIAAAAQLLTGEEVLMLTFIMAIPAVAALALLGRHEIRNRIPYVLAGTAAALITFCILAAYPLSVQFLGPQQVHGLLQPQDVYQASPLAFVVPTSYQFLGSLGIVGRTSTLDTNVFIGIPLVALAAVTAIWLRRRRVVLVAAFTAVVAMVLSLGGYLYLDRGRIKVPLPWRIFDHLPVVDNLLPVRSILFAYLALAVLVAVFLDVVLRRARAGRALAGAAATVIALAPLFPALPYATTQFPVPAFFTDGSAARVSTAGSTLITPYAAPGPVVWWAVARLAFSSPQGLVYTPGSPTPLWGVPLNPLGTEMDRLDSGGASAPPAIDAGIRQTYLYDLKSEGVRTVIVGPGTGEAQEVRFFTELLGGPGTSAGGVVVWNDVKP